MPICCRACTRPRSCCSPRTRIVLWRSPLAGSAQPSVMAASDNRTFATMAAASTEIQLKPNTGPDAPLSHRLSRRVEEYTRLARLDRPVGTWLLLWPALWGLWIASDGIPKPKVLIIFVLGVVIMRAAGCVI